MGRLVRISIYALIIIILYFWVTAILKSYQNGKTEEPMESISTDTLLKDSLIIDTSLQTMNDESDLLSNEDIVDGKINYDALDEKVKKLEDTKQVNKLSGQEKPKDESSHPVVEKPSIKPKPAIQKPKEEQGIVNAKGKSNTGPFMVMAGSYLLRENADKMVKKLKGLGYSKAEVIVFNSSEFFSVIAIKHPSENEAKSSVADLKSKGVDSFVKKK